MQAEEVRFRTAAFGGFQRADVLDYIRETAQQQELALSQANTRAAEAEDQLWQTESELAEARRELAALREAAEPAQTGEPDPLRAELDALRAENGDLRARNQALEGEKASLQARLDDWAPHVSSYDILKAQVGEIELDARARSAALLQQAEQRQQALFDRAEATLRHTEQKFRTVRGSADAALAHLSAELSRIQEELAALECTLDQDVSAVSALHVEQAPEGGADGE